MASPPRDSPGTSARGRNEASVHERPRETSEADATGRDEGAEPSRNDDGLGRDASRGKGGRSWREEGTERGKDGVELVGGDGSKRLGGIDGVERVGDYGLKHSRGEDGVERIGDDGLKHSRGKDGVESVGGNDGPERDVGSKHGHSHGSEKLEHGCSRAGDGIEHGHSHGNDGLKHGHSHGNDELKHGHSRGDDGTKHGHSYADGKEAAVYAHSRANDDSEHGHSHAGGTSHEHSHGHVDDMARKKNDVRGLARGVVVDDKTKKTGHVQEKRPDPGNDLQMKTIPTQPSTTKKSKSLWSQLLSGDSDSDNGDDDNETINVQQAEPQDYPENSTPELDEQDLSGIQILGRHLARVKLEAEERDHSYRTRISQLEREKLQQQQVLRQSNDRVAEFEDQIKKLEIQNTRKWQIETRDHWIAQVESLKAERVKLRLENEKMNEQLTRLTGDDGSEATSSPSHLKKTINVEDKNHSEDWFRENLKQTLSSLANERKEKEELRRELERIKASATDYEAEAKALKKKLDFELELKWERMREMLKEEEEEKSRASSFLDMVVEVVAPTNLLPVD